MVEKSGVEKFTVEMSGVEKFMVEKSGVEKFLLALGLKSGIVNVRTTRKYKIMSKIHIHTRHIGAISRN